MPKFYIIPHYILEDISSKHGMSMGVLSDVLETYANKIEALTSEMAISYWIQVKALGYANESMIDVWDEHLNLRTRFFLGVDSEGKPHRLYMEQKEK